MNILNKNLENQEIYNSKFSEILENMEIFDNEKTMKMMSKRKKNNNQDKNNSNKMKIILIVLIKKAKMIQLNEGVGWSR